MKRIAFLLAAVGLIAACKKDNTLSGGSTADIPAAPASFGQNVLVEQFTSSLNGVCPAADLQLDTLSALFSDRFIGVNVHVGDSLAALQITNTTTGANLMSDLYNPLSIIPSGMVNRNVTDPSIDLSTNDYYTKVPIALGLSPRCGIALDANDVANGYLSLNVHIGFSADMPGSYRLHLYLVEDGFSSLDSSYDQFNEFSQFGGTTPDPSSFLYDLPYEINGYTYNHILRKILSSGGLNGEVINPNLAVKGNEIINNYVIDLAGVDVAHSSIVAFVDKYGTTGTSHRIENARMVKIGKVASWN